MYNGNNFLTFTLKITVDELLVYFFRLCFKTYQPFKWAGLLLKSIFDATPYKTATLWPLTSYHTNHPSQTIKTCW